MFCSSLLVVKQEAHLSAGLKEAQLVQLAAPQQVCNADVITRDKAPVLQPERLHHLQKQD